MCNGAERGTGSRGGWHGVRLVCRTLGTLTETSASVALTSVQVRRGMWVGIKKRASAHRAYRSPGISIAHGPGWAEHDRRDTYFIKQARMSLADAVSLRLCQEHGHGDCCTRCSHSIYESIRRLSGSADIIDDQHLTVPEVFGIDMHIVLDIRRQFIVTCYMCPFAAAVHLYAVETVDGTRHLAEQFRKPFPASYMSTSSAGWYADNDCFRKIHGSQCP